MALEAFSTSAEARLEQISWYRLGRKVGVEGGRDVWAAAVCRPAREEGTERISLKPPFPDQIFLFILLVLLSPSWYARAAKEMGAYLLVVD